MKKFARKRDCLDQFKDYWMAAICSPQWINDGMKNLITNTCFISKVFYRCLMNTDCNVVLTWILLIWHTCKPQTLHVYPLPRDHALQRIKCHPLITHFDACTVTQALHVQSRSLTHCSLVTFFGPKNAFNLDTFTQICWWHQN